RGRSRLFGQELKDAVFDDPGFETALAHGGDAVEPTVAWIAGFEARLDDEVAVVEVGGAATPRASRILSFKIRSP
ncbi:MAG TPA: hypothetical protein VFS35_05845, partial [Terrimicrobiaceae bacterium]|nr:hypothetical protein [Terrimicrobiaceae bacterium]